VNGGDGNLYGTTTGGGTTKGSVFRITTAGTLTTIHRFNGTDGGDPSGTLFLASDGKLYGTTSTGGLHNAGTVYRIATDGTFASLHSFDTSVGEGSSPAGGVTEASDGNFYGTTSFGGGNFLGTVFVVTPAGGFATIGEFTTATGYTPRGRLVQGLDGFLYGTNYGGGDHASCFGCGTVFKVAQGVPPTTSTSTSSSTSTSTSSTTSTNATTTSTATSPPPTTSSTSTSTTAPVTTSTVGQLPNPTTTTLPSGGCAATPVGPTFASIRCRLEALRADVNAESGLGAFQPKLVQNLDKAIARTDDARGLCGDGNAKKAKKRLQQVKKALTQYVHRLNGLPARKKLDAALRQSFVAAGEAITPDVGSLRSSLACPADAT
jgi:uncharacterized repeat protein (TIGR03803 family)